MTLNHPLQFRDVLCCSPKAKRRICEADSWSLAVADTSEKFKLWLNEFTMFKCLVFWMCNQMTTITTTCRKHVWFNNSVCFQMWAVVWVVHTTVAMLMAEFLDQNWSQKLVQKKMMRKAQRRDRLLNPKVSLKSCKLHTQLAMLLPHMANLLL